MKKEEFIKILENEPLIEGPLSHAFSDWHTFEENANRNLFFGIGLCTSEQPSIGIPFDIVMFFLLAEKLRRVLHFQTIIVLIADVHAATNEFMDDNLVEKTRNKTLVTLKKLARNFSIKNVEFLFASEIRKNQSFHEIKELIPKLANKYLCEELADILWLAKHKNVAFKLSWSIDGSLKTSGHDERFFDNELKRVTDLPISIVFIKAGRTFSPNKPKASPYIMTNDEERVIMDPEENVVKKMNLVTKKFPDKKQLIATKRHLGQIVRLFEKLFVQLPHKSLEEKIQFIIDIAVHG